MNRTGTFTVAGAGLGGSLLAGLLGKNGRRLDVYEMRPDPRRSGGGSGRSINLAISTRGMHALGRVGLAERVRKMAVPMRGRMIHSPRGRLSFQRYGTRERQVLNSVSRSELNAALLEKAESFPGVRFHFGKKCVGVDLGTGDLLLQDTGTGETVSVPTDGLVGADGAFSAIRKQMLRTDHFTFQESYLSHGYKELTIPPGPGGGHTMETNALHIWPRGGYMMIALSNRDGSFTCTLFWPLEKPGSFVGLGTEAEVRSLYRRSFPDAVSLLPDLAGDFFGNPTGSLVTIRCKPWHLGGRAALLGDACHAVVPFYGQGANAAFEDGVVLEECLEKHDADRQAAFAEYQLLRRQNTDVLAELSLANFREMRARTASAAFRWKKTAGRGLHRLFPAWFIPLYTLVTFTRVPYAEAVRRSRRQNLLVGILVSILSLIAGTLIWRSVFFNS